MKTMLSLLASLLILTLTARAANETNLAVVRAADDERVAASVAADRVRLEAIYSDDLQFGHSNGKFDTKATQIHWITTGDSKYENFEYKERTFLPAAPGIVLMKGRVLQPLRNQKTGERTVYDLIYLAVWREEKGKWRFLAWQSCRYTEPASPAKKKNS